MARLIYLSFGIVAYVIFLGTFLYLIAFVGAVSFAPRTVDTGGEGLHSATALAIDMALITIFAFQHSIMARPAFKRYWTKVVPSPIERSTYVLFSSATLILLMALWQPLPSIIWAVEQPILAGIMWALFGLGWLIVLLSTFLISHFELFGLKQVWSNLRHEASVAPVFRQPFFYRIVRHPLYSGFFLAFWATPVMTTGHLVLALGLSIFMLIAIQLEEHDLIGVFGERYINYRTKTGMLLPRMWGRHID